MRVQARTLKLHSPQYRKTPLGHSKCRRLAVISTMDVKELIQVKEIPFSLRENQP